MFRWRWLNVNSPQNWIHPLLKTSALKAKNVYSCKKNYVVYFVFRSQVFQKFPYNVICKVAQSSGLHTWLIQQIMILIMVLLILCWCTVIQYLSFCLLPLCVQWLAVAFWLVIYMYDHLIGSGCYSQQDETSWLMSFSLCPLALVKQR